MEIKWFNEVSHMVFIVKDSIVSMDVLAAGAGRVHRHRWQSVEFVVQVD